MHRIPCTLLFTVSLVLAFGSAGRATDPDPGTADEQVLKEVGLSTDGVALLDYFRKRTLTDADRQQIDTLIRQLGDSSFKVREKASNELVAKGPIARPFLRQAAKDRDPEVVRRAEGCLRLIGQADASAVVPGAVARLVGLRKPAGAAEVLLNFIPFAEDENLAGEVQAALAAVAVRDGKPDKVLLVALADKHPGRRAAAVEALCRAGLAGKQPEIHQLLQDGDAGVRLRAALGLATARQKESVPVLIDLLVDLPQERAWQAEDLLLRLAGEDAPPGSLGRDAAARQKCRAAWAAWWRDHASTADLARIEGTGRELGYTLLVLLSANMVVELDAQNKPRLQIGGLDFPLDAQILPGDRILVAEHNADRVTERDRKGDILWEKRVDKPLMAQRLDNGHTFIATQLRLFEVDRDGKEFFSYSRPMGEPFMKALKLPNGEVACVTMLRRFIRLDRSGRELQNIPANVATSGGRIDVLPGGRVLIPEKTNNRVVEYDAEGRMVWQAPFPEPVAAVRLPNGHTLITSFNQNRAVELDRTGKEVWEYNARTRVTRAFRR
jgi:hypothetical protein